LNWYRAMAAADYRDCPPVEVPTTFVWSTGDMALRRTQAEATRRYVLGDYRFVQLEGVTHWIPEQAAAELASEIALRSSPW
jgi:pimeloyl-ACP methyl ester carboxylesterase